MYIKFTTKNISKYLESVRNIVAAVFIYLLPFIKILSEQFSAKRRREFSHIKILKTKTNHTT